MLYLPAATFVFGNILFSGSIDPPPPPPQTTNAIVYLTNSEIHYFTGRWTEIAQSV
jgi:hypothetical protein